jgi:hypothetical protein
MVNRLPTDKPPTACAFGGQPFKVHDNHVAACRTTSSKLCAVGLAMIVAGP